MKNYLRPFAQFLVSQNSKGKYESRKILDFVRKNKKTYFFSNFFISFVVSSTFLVILKFFINFGLF
jgi:hypothetical protein